MTTAEINYQTGCLLSSMFDQKLQVNNVRIQWYACDRGGILNTNIFLNLYIQFNMTMIKRYMNKRCKWEYNGSNTAYDVVSQISTNMTTNIYPTAY